MARIQIIIEDKGDRVKTTITPPLERISAEVAIKTPNGMIQKRPMTAAERYAFLVAFAMVEASKNLDKYKDKNIVTPGEFI